MEQRELAVVLNESEINSKAQELVALMIEFDTVEDERRAATAQFSERLKELRNRMRALSREIRERKEPIPYTRRWNKANSSPRQHQ